MELDLLLKPAKVLVTGASGQAGSAFCLLAEEDPFFQVAGLSLAKLDITDAEQVRQRLAEYLPDYVVNCAGLDDLTLQDAESERFYAVNTVGAEQLALACGDLSIPLLHLSTDYVFDGHYSSGYTEQDEVSPLGVYGDSKWQGEERIRQVLPRHIILRASWLFSARGNNFLTQTLAAARQQQSLEVLSDHLGCPTSAHDLARVIVAVLKQLHSGADGWGTYHYCGAEVISRYDFCKEILIAASEYESLEVEKLVPLTTDPEHGGDGTICSSILVCKKLLNIFGIRQRPWRHELKAIMREMYTQSASAE